MKFGDKIENLQEYIPFSYKPDMIRLDANESCLDISDELKAGLLEVVSNVVLNRYPDPYCKELRAAFSEYYNICQENVVVGNGSDELISIIFSSLVSVDSKVLTVAPDFSMYSFYADLYGRNVDVYKKNENYNFNVNDFINYINEKKYDFVIFSNPCNPTGQGLERSDILRIIENSNAAICVDEAYMDFWDERESVMKDVNTHENLLVLRTLSKAIGLASCRLGFVVANRKIISMFNKVKSPYNVNTVSQEIGRYVLRNSSVLRESATFLKNQTLKLSDGIKNLNLKDAVVYNTKTNFVFIDIPYAKIIFEKLKEKNIVIRCFGSDKLRITAGTDFENNAVIKAMGEICL